MAFPGVMYGCESWTIKKAEHWRSDAFKLVVREYSSEYLLLQGHPKRNQPWIFIGRTDAEAEAPIVWPFDVKGWLTGKDWYWERLRARGEGNNRRWDGWMASPTQWTKWVWVKSGSWWWTGRPGLHGVAKSQTQLSNWTELNFDYF